MGNKVIGQKSIQNEVQKQIKFGERSLISIVKPTTCTNVSTLFWKDTLHVSDGLSFHHQEFKTLHTATGICQTDTAVC